MQQFLIFISQQNYRINLAKADFIYLEQRVIKSQGG